MKDLFMPPEWRLHHCCWMGWPARRDSWPFDLTRARASWIAVVRAIAQFEPVKVIASSEESEEAKRWCGNLAEVVTLPIDDIWLRDTGPSFLINGRGDLAGVAWQFNAWGENRETLADYQQDAALAKRILAYSQVTCYEAPLFLEGGAIHLDGEGTLLTTEECLLNPSRNPNLNREQIEAWLGQYLGITKVIWLGQGLQDDETAGHIDNLACFVRPGVVLALSCRDPADNNYAVLQDNLQRLRKATDAQGRKLEVIEIEQPSQRNASNGLRLALSYLNFYLANGGVVIPTFDDPADQAALEVLQKVFPERRRVTVAGLDLVYGGGCVHCITQQQPVP